MNDRRTVGAGAMSPEAWPAGLRQQAEDIEARRWAPDVGRTLAGRRGVISATASPIGVEAGLQALRLDGSAADAAAAVALAQIATQLGSVASYAGILSLLYFEAATGEVHSLDAGYNTYRAETDPETIPASNMGPLASALPGVRPGPEEGGDGRKTLVPGFMAGLEAMHARFGRLPFAALFEPAIWYATHGVRISPILAAYFDLRRECLAKTPAGRRFMGQAGVDQPTAGDLFVQSELAETLAKVAEHGARHMYAGDWAAAFVEAVRAAGGKATSKDLAAYAPIWSEPASTDVFGHRVCVPGPPNRSDLQILTGLDLAEALRLGARGPCWRDPQSFRDLARIDRFVAAAPSLPPAALEALLDTGVDVSPAARRGKSFAEAAASVFDRIFAPLPPEEPRHSDAIVAVDERGDIAVMTHTINTVVWGDTGLVVGGVPLPDSAGFQQGYLATLSPGDRVANTIACTLSLKDGRPVLLTAPIGSSLAPETLKTLVSVLGQGASAAEAAAAPPLLLDMAEDGASMLLGERTAAIPRQAYDPAFLDALKASGVAVSEKTPQQWMGWRGTLAMAAFDPATGEATAPETPDVLVFAGAL